MFKKTISGIGLVALAALLLAGTASPVDASVAFKAFLRDGSINPLGGGTLLTDLTIPAEPTNASADYQPPTNTTGPFAENGETLTDDAGGLPGGTAFDYLPLFDIYVFDVDVSSSNFANPTLFRNSLTSIDGNGDLDSSGFVLHGIKNLTFTWYTGAFAIDTDLSTSLAAAANDTGDFFADGAGSFGTSAAKDNRLFFSCGSSPCASPGIASKAATWEITNGFGVDKPNSDIFFNFISATSTPITEVTLLVTGTIVSPGGGGYNANITAVNAIPLPPAALLFGTALFGIGALRRWKDKKDMAVTA